MGKQYLLGNSIDDFQTALNYFEEALSHDASFAGAYAGLCEVQLGLYSKTGNTIHFSAAKLACERALAIDANRTEVHIALGMLFRRNGDYPRAEAEQRMALESQNVEALMEMGYTLADQGRIREAETLMLRAEVLQPDHWPVHDALFSFYRQFDDQPGRYERAVKHAMRVVELNPKSSAAWNNLGTAYHSLQQFDAAKTAWDKALQLEPTRTAYTNRGLQYYYKGEYANSAEMQLKAIELAPNDHRVWGRLAESYRAMGDHEAMQKKAYSTAIPLAESTLKINGQDWRTGALLAIYYAFSEREDDAQRQIESALDISNRNPEALLYAALVSYALGDTEATLTMLEEMIEADQTYRIYAANEPDLKSLRGNERFERLINP
jgi:Flp pilus assembly protein TadD